MAMHFLFTAADAQSDKVNIGKALTGKLLALNIAFSDKDGDSKYRDGGERLGCYLSGAKRNAHWPLDQSSSYSRNL